MAHSKSLRVIGQSLEAARLSAFELRMDGSDYFVSSDVLTTAAEWILRHAVSPTDEPEHGTPQSQLIRSVRFNPITISRLDDQARKQRRNDFLPNRQAYNRLSQLLRALGDHLDQSDVSAFQISWRQDSASVNFNSLNGQSDSRTFTADKLHQLGSHLRFRRSSGTRADSKAPPLNRSK
jgi:hypothetical protein